MSDLYVRVYAKTQAGTHPNLAHPGGLQLLSGGSMWINDGYLARLIIDGDATLDPAEEWKLKNPPGETPDGEPPAGTAAK
jgi:hypothetical protein